MALYYTGLLWAAVFVHGTTACVLSCGLLPDLPACTVLLLHVLCSGPRDRGLA
jgi:hypothetical protein